MNNMFNKLKNNIGAVILITILGLILMGATYVNVGPTTNFGGDVGVPSGSGYYINDVLLTYSDVDAQQTDAALTSISGLTYVEDSLIKMTANDTYAVRTLAEVKTDLSLNLVENTALSTWAGTSSITTVGTIGTGAWNGDVLLPAYGGTGVANGANNTITFTGNYTLGLTLTANTAVTLPTSGTLYGTKADSITSAELLSSLTDETGTGVVVFGTSPIFTTSIKTPIIYGAGSTYLRIGDAGTTSHALSSEDDLLITGILEVNGSVFFDQTAYTNTFLLTQGWFGDSGEENRVTFFQNGMTSDHVTQFALSNNDKIMTITSRANYLKDHDHTAQANPTIFIHSTTNPDDANDEWISFTHDVTDGIITTGSGDLILDPAGLDVCIDVPTNNNPGLKFTENSGLKWHIYNDNATDALEVYANTTRRYSFGADGTAIADVAWNTFSPKITATGRDLLAVALEDANKPVKPYEGIPVCKKDSELFDLVKEKYEYQYQEEDKNGLVFDENGEPIMITVVRAKEVKVPRDRLPNEFKTQAEVDVEFDKYSKSPAKIAIASARYLEYLTGIIDAMQLKIDELEVRIQKLENPIEPK